MTAVIMLMRVLAYNVALGGERERRREREREKERKEICSERDGPSLPEEY